MRYLNAAVLMLSLANCAELSFAGLPFMDEAASAPLVCSSASPCPPSYRCSFGTCTDVMQEFREVAIAVRLGDQIQHLKSVDLSNSTQFDTALSHERVVVGRVVTTEDKGIEAAIVARLTESVEGHPVVRQARTDADGHFRLQLTQGSVWSLDVTPIGDEIPAPPRTTLRQITGDRIADGAVVIEVPAATEYPVYTGQLVSADGDRVQAFARLQELGTPDTEQLTLQITDSDGRYVGNHIGVDDEGRFRFRAHPDMDQVVLLGRGPRAQHPAAVTEPIELDPEQPDLGEVVFPIETGRSLLSVTTSNPLELSSLPVVGELRVRPLAAKGRVVHRLALSGATATQIELPLGRYSIDLLPESSTGFAPVLNREVEVRNGATNALVIPLEPLIELTGRVVTPDGAPAVNVRIVSRQSEIQAEALTDETGAFSLKVQNGATFISAVPAPPSPRVLVEMTLLGSQSLNLVIDDGIMLTGSLMRPDAQETQGNAVLSVLAPWKTFDGAAVVLGETVVNSDGMFSVALPPF